MRIKKTSTGTQYPELRWCQKIRVGEWFHQSRRSLQPKVWDGCTTFSPKILLRSNRLTPVVILRELICSSSEIGARSISGETRRPPDILCLKHNYTTARTGARLSGTPRAIEPFGLGRLHGLSLGLGGYDGCGACSTAIYLGPVVRASFPITYFCFGCFSFHTGTHQPYK